MVRFVPITVMAAVSDARRLAISVTQQLKPKPLLTLHT
ncbi:hypothetical protein SeseC_02452 [Streptococcus equi subsp. zooepidemicus ATCC 35246]|nr:hypothetical protein SeseC_02452 [Streptococcus equi subsp. zooepidemicus ATCC 35246]